MGRTALLVAFLTISMAASLLGTTMTPVELTCPVDGESVEGWKIMSTNTFGGVDSDFCPHAVGDQPREWVIATCARCLYSGYPDDFDEEFDEDEKKELDEALSEWRKEIPEDERGRLPAWIRYELAAACVEAVEICSEESMAHLYHRAAWCVRDEIILPAMMAADIGRMRDAAERKLVKESLKERGFELEAEFKVLGGLALMEFAVDKFEEQVLEGQGDSIAEDELNLIRWRHRLGDGSHVSILLEKMENRSEADEDGDLARLKNLISKERSYLEKSAAMLEKHFQMLESQNSQKSVVAYLIGDCHRRCAKNDEATRFYKMAISLEAIRGDIVPLSEYQLDRLGEEFRLSEDKREALIKSELQRLVKQLMDPSHSGKAAVILQEVAKVGLITDPEIIDEIIKGTKHSDKDVRWFATGLLKWVPDPRVREPLKKVLLEDPDSGPKWAAIEALARVGDFSSVEAIVTYLKSERANLEDSNIHALEDAIQALERFTNHMLEREDYFRGPEEMESLLSGWIELWESNSGLDEDEWIRRGFSAAGYEFESIYSEKDIPRLIEVMGQRTWPCGFHANEILKRLTKQDFDDAGEEKVEWWDWQIGGGTDDACAVIRAWEKWWEGRQGSN